ncbi:MAG: LexA family protein [Shinella sp.]|uniref:LexA family protein n=1 Tax=Shinella sp. TaxID=1870904 RepID=UPI00403723AC
MRDEMTKQYLDWIRENLKKTGKTQSGLASHLGIAHPQITQLLKGNRKLKVDELPRIAEYLEANLPSGDVVPSSGGLTEGVVAGLVEAGAFREVDEFDQSDRQRVAIPRDELFPNARQLLFDCSGDSMNDLKPRPILPGDRLVTISYEDVEHLVELKSGMVVVVQREREGGHFREWSVKQLELYPDRSEFHPRSTNSKHKPIIIRQDHEADDGVTVQVIALVRRVMNEMPGF